MKTDQVQKLINDIVKCGLENVKSKDSECHTIWQAQGCSSLDEFHVPEPWNGDIANAELLFISINPGYTANELYPRKGYDWWIDGNGQLLDERINDFFSNRFSSQNGYVKSENGRKFSIRMEDGSYKRLKGVSFWSDVHNIARIVLNRDVQIGKDYAITEIIHCKTRTENGVNRKCYEQCLTKWFNQILDVAKNVRSIVVVGKNPRDYVGRFLQIENPQCYKWYECTTLFGRNYKLLFVDHHAARKPGRNERIVNCVKKS